jgi:hypothetical protein
LEEEVVVQVLAEMVELVWAAFVVLEAEVVQEAGLIWMAEADLEGDIVAARSPEVLWQTRLSEPRESRQCLTSMIAYQHSTIPSRPLIYSNSHPRSLPNLQGMDGTLAHHR